MPGPATVFVLQWEAKIIQSQTREFAFFAKQIIKRTHAKSIQKTQANIR